MPHRYDQELNATLTLGISTAECFQLVNEMEFPVGEPIEINYARHYSEE